VAGGHRFGNRTPMPGRLARFSGWPRMAEGGQDGILSRGTGEQGRVAPATTTSRALLTALAYLG
jgi:hypothetical protein